MQVWLAALRETEKQDSSEQHLICEDHFLPEDISNNGVSKEAIPIMPHCLDGPLISPWGAESSEDDDPWAAGGDDCEGEGGDGDVIPFKSKISIPEALPAADQVTSAPCVSFAVTHKVELNRLHLHFTALQETPLLKLHLKGNSLVDLKKK